MINYTVQLKQY